MDIYESPKYDCIGDIPLISRLNLFQMDYIFIKLSLHFISSYKDTDLAIDIPD